MFNAQYRLVSYRKFFQRIKEVKIAKQNALVELLKARMEKEQTRLLILKTT